MYKIPLFDLSFDKKEADSILSVIQSGWISMGEITQQFETKFSEYINVKHAIAVSNGTAALHLAHLAVGIGKGDEVICPSLTFVAGANAIRYCHADPVFADIETIDDLCISPSDIEKKITQKTKAVQVMHYAGYPCMMDQIMKIAEKNGLYVIEDCAHSPGTEFQGEKCGSIGDVGCFSFFSNKNMTTGEGGMVTTNDDKLAEKIRLMRSHGMTSLSWDRVKGHSFSYDVVENGFNYRIDEIRSSIGIVQLEKLTANTLLRKKLVHQYIQELSKIDGLMIPFAQRDDSASYHIFSVIIPGNIHRDEFMEYMKNKGVQTSIHYPPVHLFSYYKNKRKSMLPLTEEVAVRCVSLPLYPNMKVDDVTYICNLIADYF